MSKIRKIPGDQSCKTELTELLLLLQSIFIEVFRLLGKNTLFLDTSHPLTEFLILMMGCCSIFVNPVQELLLRPGQNFVAERAKAPSDKYRKPSSSLYLFEFTFERQLVLGAILGMSMETFLELHLQLQSFPAQLLVSILIKLV